MRTKRVLQKAALELFAKQGYDDTTTEEIAERAELSPRTFFRYFPTKESVLFVGEYDWFQSFVAAYADQPPTMSDIDAMLETLVAQSPSLARIRKSLRLYERAVASSATLRGRVQDHLQDDIAQLAAAIANRRGLDSPDESCSLLAAVCLVTYRRGLTLWLDGPATADPSEAIVREFELLSQLAANSASPPAGRRRRAKT